MRILVMAILFYGFAWATHAQTSNSDVVISAPEFSVSNLTADRDALENNANLTDEQKANATESYNAAISALQNAADSLQTANRIQAELENSPVTIEQLHDEIDRVQAMQENAPDPADVTITGETLLKLEQDLISKESELRTLQAEVEGIGVALESLLQRPLREELSQAQERLSAITADLDTAIEGELDVPGRARLASLEARQYYRRAQSLMLEREIASLSTRQQILTLRRDLAQLKVRRAEQSVISLQIQTGQRRLTEAEDVVQDAQDMLSVLENAHPFLVDYAATNYFMSQRLMAVATDASNSPKKQADARARRDAVKNDLDIARRLTELSQINRQSSATLRRLRNQRPSANAVKAELSETRNNIVAATQDRLWAQEQLRALPLGQFDVDELLAEWRLTDPDATLNASDIPLLRTLYTKRRSLLGEVSDAAFARISEAEDLQTIQADLLTYTQDLKSLLEQKLLWLPSVAAIDISWPDRVIRGAFQVFSLERFSRASQELLQQVRALWPIILLFGVTIATLILTRPRMRTDINTRGRKVGRVQKDSYWHTPSVIVACGLIAAPIPLLLLLIGILFKSGESPDTFVQALGQTGVELSGFAWFFLTWREWNRDQSLMGAHFKMAAGIRRTVNSHLTWFIPFGGIAIALVTLTQSSREPDIYEGFSLFAFIVTSIALSVFGFRVLWAKRNVIERALSEGSSLWRYRKILTFLIVALPFMAGLLAAAGYYDTARELLSRLFFSAGLVLATYVMYGLIRRTVVVAQRRLALRQAIDRREMSLRARQEKEEAQERGEPAPPPVNYEEIDLETMSRQSTQLLNTFVVLGFAFLMWVFWQDLLPALSVFDNVGLWKHTVRNEVGESVEEWVTLWNIIQALAIIVLTIIAARNLPGFLEVFILNRSRFDAGTRYAIVSVLGYAIIAIGIVTSFNYLGTEWSQLQWIVAALSVGIGFGLQEIIANFISGLIILFERPVRIGDYVTIGDQSGTVTRIQIRATTLRDLDNREILIPNKALITERVTNWTLSNATTRLIVKVGVAYGSDTDKARDVIAKVVHSNDRILDTPAPQVFFLGFGDSSLDFEIRVFLRSFEDRFPVSHALHTEINKALEKAGITIPFPQRDLHFINPPNLNSAT